MLGWQVEHTLSADQKGTIGWQVDRPCVGSDGNLNLYVGSYVYVTQYFRAYTVAR